MLLPVRPPTSTDRIVVAGGPRSGKSTLASRLATEIGAPEVKATDDLVGVLAWGDDSAEVATWFDATGPWVVEGVTAARALRKWLAGHPAGKPCDRVFYLPGAVAPRTPAQETMAKGERTVWCGIAGELHARGVEVMLGLPRERAA